MHTSKTGPTKLHMNPSSTDNQQLTKNVNKFSYHEKVKENKRSIIFPVIENILMIRITEYSDHQYIDNEIKGGFICNKRVYLPHF